LGGGRLSLLLLSPPGSQLEKMMMGLLDTRSLAFWTSDIHDATITDMPSVLAKIVEKVIIAATSNVYSMVLTSFNYPSVFERRIS